MYCIYLLYIIYYTLSTIILFEFYIIYTLCIHYSLFHNLITSITLFLRWYTLFLCIYRWCIIRWHYFTQLDLICTLIDNYIIYNICIYPVIWFVYLFTDIADVALNLGGADRNGQWSGPPRMIITSISI